MSESVLVVPTAALAATTPERGFVRHDQAWSAMLAARFIDRPSAEEDESYRQVIPYVVLRAGAAVFTYARNREGGEARLHDLRSVGVGGHVNPADLEGGLESFAGAPLATLVPAARREVAEEVAGVGSEAPLEWLGFIFDDSVPVSRVHFGVVLAVDVDPARVQLSDEGRMVDGRFVQPRDLAADLDSYEGWSQIVIGHLAAASPTA